MLTQHYRTDIQRASNSSSDCTTTRARKPLNHLLVSSTSVTTSSRPRALACLLHSPNSLTSTNTTIDRTLSPNIAKTTPGNPPRDVDGSQAVPIGDRCRGRTAPAMRSPPNRFLLMGVLGAVVLMGGLVPEGVNAAGNIGCLFSNTLCEDEWCFDDYAFGRCFPTKADLKEDDLVRYHLGEEELHLLEAEMQRLYHLGYRWSHTYTQCVLQALLQAIQFRADFDVTSCNDELDQDLEGALRAIEGEEQEAVNPRDLAIVRFTPSATDPHSDYADEFYFPAIEGGKLLPAPYRQHGVEAGKVGKPSSTKTPSHSGDTGSSSDQAKQQTPITSNVSSMFGSSSGSPGVKSSSGDAKPGKDTSKGSKLGKPGTQDHPGVQHKMGHQGDVNNGFPSAATKTDGFKQDKSTSYNKDPSSYGNQYGGGNSIVEPVKNYNDFPRDIPYDLHGYQADTGYGSAPSYPSETYGQEYQKAGYTSGLGYPNDGYMADQGYQNDGYMTGQGYSNDGYMSHQGYQNDGYMPHQGNQNDGYMPHQGNQNDGYMPHQGNQNDGYMPHQGYQNDEYMSHQGYQNDGYMPHQGYQNDGYMPHQGYQNDGYMYDQGYLNDVMMGDQPYEEEDDDDVSYFDPSKFDVRIPTTQRKSNKEILKQFFQVPDFDDYDVAPAYNAPNPSRSYNPIYRKRDNSTRPGLVKKFNLRNFMVDFDNYIAAEQHLNNQTKRTGGGTQSGGQLGPIQGVPASQLQALQEKLDPELRKGFMSVAIDVMRRGRYGQTKPHYNTAHLKKLAALLDELRRGSPEEPLDTMQTSDITDAMQGRQPNGAGGYLRVDKALPRDYPAPARPHTDRYAYGSDDNAGVYYDQAQEPVYYNPPAEQGYGAQFNYPQFYKTDGANYGGGYGGGYTYDYANYDYGRPMMRADGSEDPSSFVKKDEETTDSDYGTLMSAEGQPLTNNFARPERLDVKKPGHYYNVNQYRFNKFGDPFYDPNYDNAQYPPRKIGFAFYDYGIDPYHSFDNYMDVEDVDIVGAEDDGAGDGDGSYPNDEGGASGAGRDKGPYVDGKGNEIDIGLSPGRGGMIPMSRNPNEENGERFSELLRQQGLEGSSLHPGPGHQRMRMHQGRMPDLLLTDERVVDDVRNGLANQQHAKMPLGPHSMHPMRLMVPITHGAPNHTGPAHPDPTMEPQSPVPAATYVYVDVNMSFSSRWEASDLASLILHNAGLSREDIKDLRVEDNRMLFTLRDNLKGVTEQDIADKAEELSPSIEKEWNVRITRAGVASSQGNGWSLVEGGHSERRLMVGLAVVSGVMAAAVVAATGVLVLRRHAAQRSKLRGLGNRDSEASKDYQDLCRARMAAKTKSASDGLPGTHTAAAQRVSSLSKESDNGGNSPGSRSSTSSCCGRSEEPVAPNMDISTGHMVLSYMEDHLQNKSRLEQEWLALCAYEAEPSATMVAKKPTNQKKNRYPAVLPYDHNRVHLNQQANISGSDYVNASSITDHDPRNPAYIATQGPLATTTADFWQLVWEQGSVVIVMLTRLNESGHTLCHHYWPQEGSQLYHIYEVHLVSEHIWCDDYLVRSFYLKNTRTGETRTVTQFHFLSWPDTAIPASTKALLEFRRKVNKSYRGRSCPIVVHCSDGIGRAGTYILIDMVLNRMAKGAKEIDIAATLEHIRDQRANMVTTKLQFEFVLMAVAEEVHAILKALPQ